MSTLAELCIFTNIIFLLSAYTKTTFHVKQRNINGLTSREFSFYFYRKIDFGFVDRNLPRDGVIEFTVVLIKTKEDIERY